MASVATTVDFLAYIELPLLAELDGSINHVRPIISELAGGWEITMFRDAARRLPSRQLHLDTVRTLFTHVSAYNEEIRELLAFCVSVTPQMTCWNDSNIGLPPAYIELEFISAFICESLSKVEFVREDAPIIMELLREMGRSGAHMPRADIHGSLTPFSCALIARNVAEHDDNYTRLGSVFRYTGAKMSNHLRAVSRTFMLKCAVDLHRKEFSNVRDTLRRASLRKVSTQYDARYVISARFHSAKFREEPRKVADRERLRDDEQTARRTAILLGIAEVPTYDEAVQLVAEWYVENVAADA